MASVQHGYLWPKQLHGDHLAEIILSMGQGAHMVKADIKEAY